MTFTQKGEIGTHAMWSKPKKDKYHVFWYTCIYIRTLNWVCLMCVICKSVPFLSFTSNVISSCHWIFIFHGCIIYLLLPLPYIFSSLLCLWMSKSFLSFSVMRKNIRSIIRNHTLLCMISPFQASFFSVPSF